MFLQKSLICKLGEAMTKSIEAVLKAVNTLGLVFTLIFVTHL